MRFNNYLKIFVIVILLPFMSLGTIGCSTVNTISNWKEIQNDHPILVTTRSGKEYRLDKWRIYNDSIIVSLQTDMPKVFLKDSIATLATINNNTTKVLKTTFTVVGITAGVILIIYLVRAAMGISSLPIRSD
jgi:hypothetical protein